MYISMSLQYTKTFPFQLDFPNFQATGLFDSFSAILVIFCSENTNHISTFFLHRSAQAVSSRLPMALLNYLLVTFWIIFSQCSTVTSFTKQDAWNTVVLKCLFLREKKSVQKTLLSVPIEIHTFYSVVWRHRQGNWKRKKTPTWLHVNQSWS